MEALRQDDPRRIGPYALLSRLRETASAVQYLARSADGTTVVVSAARPALAGLPAFRRRFQAEAQTARRLAGGWVQAPADSGAGGSGLWTAAPYVPALTLGEAVGLAGPLPERTVRTLGAALAETLARVHATGAVLHGLAADTVLLASDGPRLTAFGALGASVAAEAGPGGQLSVRLGYLTPEQLTGREPGPASDIFVLGLLLAYAATGATPLAAGPEGAAAERIAHAEPELAAVPQELRALIARCLAKSPTDRPAPGVLAAELALEGAAALTRHGWLPDRLVSALTDQAARALEPGAGTGAQNLVPLPAPSHHLGSAPGPEPRSPGGPGDPARHGAPSPAPGTAGETGDTGKTGGTGETGGAGVTGGTPAGAADVGGGPTLHLPALRRTAAPAVSTGAAPAVTAAGGAPQPGPAPLPHPGAALALPHATASAPRPPARTAAPRGLGGLSRRGLFTGIAAGAAGLVVGGGAVLALSGGEDDAPARPAGGSKPVARPEPLPGLAPDPLWHYQHPVAADGPPARLWRDQVLLIPGGELTTGLDLRTGRPLWEQKAAGTDYAPEAADGTHCFVVTPADFLWLSAKDGQVRHRVPYGPLLTKGQKDARAVLGAKVAADGPVVWFAAKVDTLGGKKDKVTRTRSYLFAYDMAARKELWRTEVPNGRSGALPRYETVGIRPDSLLLRRKTSSMTAAQQKKARDRAAFVLVDRRTGRTLWSKFFAGVRPSAGITDDPSGRLYAAVEGDLQAYDTRSGRKLWKLKAASGSSDDAPYGFGHGVVRDKTLYVPGDSNEVYAVDRTTGAQRWKRATEYPGRAAPRIALSSSGRTVFALNETQATAIGARDGRRLWKFQDSGVTAPGAEEASASYRAEAFGSRAVLWRGRNFYALPLD
ncbi:PQQ-binding-like beta-propeller repeat protein [Streptomyces sp. Wb2n-11]|uniref:outer membrane protein assembly factor BamB family protein n=1 Tax=Streptomyces sp. Wb2n-11 TaxID=1030533 RepID=UPI000AF4A679|nr:PQQ-binding-like beta-propeller repeat protein [Streptomyces sp. Wb2n-11]